MRNVRAILKSLCAKCKSVCADWRSGGGYVSVLSPEGLDVDLSVSQMMSNYDIGRLVSSVGVQDKHRAEIR